jgi:TatD DNase family protein
VIDTHAHLDALEDADQAVERALAAGVTRIVTVGTGIDSCRRALAIAERHDAVFAALGIDPHRAGTPDADRVDELRELLAHPKAVAVGECGLDYHYGAERKAEQQQLFDAQLELAAETGKPVVIHTRAANDDTAAALRAHPGTVVLHCFSEPHLLPIAQEHGWYVSFAGNVTYPKATDLRLSSRVVAEARLLAETDSPYLAPQPVRGRRNEPAYVAHTVAELARVRGADADELGRRIVANAAAAFALP